MKFKKKGEATASDSTSRYRKKMKFKKNIKQNLIHMKRLLKEINKFI